MSDNATEADDWPWERRRDDAIVVTIWTLMLLYAFVSNVLILLGIMRSASMRQATSYWFIISLAMCDIVMTLISLLHLVPATAFHSAYVQKHSWRNIWVIFFYDLFWYTAVLELGVMAINRFASIVYPMDYKRLFSPQRTVLLIILLYSMGMMASLPTLFPCCHTLWNADFYITEYYPMDTWFKYVDIGVNSFALLLMVFCYIVIIFKVRESRKAMAKYQLTVRQRQEHQSKDSNFDSVVKRNSSLRPPRSQVSKKEMRLFIQFFIVSVVFLLTWTTWQWLPYMSDSKWAYFVMTSLFFINNSVNPTVYMIFNTQLRREVHFVLCREHAMAAADARRRRTMLNRQRHNNNNHLIRHTRLLSEDVSVCNGGGGDARATFDSSYSNSSSEFTDRRKSKKQPGDEAGVDDRHVLKPSALANRDGGLVFENRVSGLRSSSPDTPLISTNVSTV